MWSGVEDPCVTRVDDLLPVVRGSRCSLEMSGKGLFFYAGAIQRELLAAIAQS